MILKPWKGGHTGRQGYWLVRAMSDREGRLIELSGHLKFRYGNNVIKDLQIKMKANTQNFLQSNAKLKTNKRLFAKNPPFLV